jgi:hypothetical protein
VTLVKDARVVCPIKSALSCQLLALGNRTRAAAQLCRLRAES